MDRSQIRRATVADAPVLTALMHASGAYQGNYSSILDGYEITPAQIERDVIYLAEQDGRMTGFYSLVPVGEPELDLLFVADDAQGTGLGALLIGHMKEQARQRGITRIKIVSHPPSAGFYERMGATRIGTAPSTPKVGWPRPILSLDL